MKSKKPIDCRASSRDFSVLTDFLCGPSKEVSDERKFVPVDMVEASKKRTYAGSIVNGKIQQ